MNHKPEQLAAAIDRAIRDVLAKGFQDPRISGLITITGVRVSGDLKRAVVGISVYPAEKGTLTMHGLASAAPFVRREVGDMIRVRAMPDLIFERDDSLKKQAKVFEALEKARSVTPPQPPADVEPSAPAGDPQP